MRAAAAAGARTSCWRAAARRRTHTGQDLLSCTCMFRHMAVLRGAFSGASASAGFVLHSGCGFGVRDVSVLYFRGSVNGSFLWQRTPKPKPRAKRRLEARGTHPGILPVTRHATQCRQTQHQLSERGCREHEHEHEIMTKRLPSREPVLCRLLLGGRERASPTFLLRRAAIGSPAMSRSGAETTAQRIRLGECVKFLDG